MSEEVGKDFGHYSEEVSKVFLLLCRNFFLYHDPPSFLSVRSLPESLNPQNIKFWYQTTLRTEPPVCGPAKTEK